MGLDDFSSGTFKNNYYRHFERILRAIKYLQKNEYIDDWVFFKKNNRGYFEKYFKKPNTISSADVDCIYLIVKSPRWLDKYFDKSKYYADPNSNEQFIIPEHKIKRLKVKDIKEIRNKLKMKQNEICKEIGRSVKWISNMENNKTENLLNEQISAKILKLYKDQTGKDY